MTDGKYYWLKLKRDFFKRHDIRIVEEMTNGKEYILFYLKLLCESVDHEGGLRFSNQIPYNDEMLATITNTNIDIVRSAVKIFTELQMMDVLDDGTIFMNEVAGMIGSAANNDNANRQRRYRERQKTEEPLQLRYDSVTKNNESKSKSKRKSIDIEKDIYSTSSDEVIDHLNMRTGSKYRHSESSRKNISARLKEGFTVQDCKDVIDKKCVEWVGTEYEKYLNPETLFRPSHFEKYLNQKVVKKGQNVF